MGIVSNQYDSMLNLVRQSAVNAGRSADEVQLLAVSKTFPAEDIAELYSHGCRIFGESRIQELDVKAAALPADIEWHLIGLLQSNKVRKAVRLASVIHSVDSAALAERIDRIAGEEGKSPGVLLEVNVSGEVSKSGLAPAELDTVAEIAAKAQNFRWLGLMTVAPEAASADELKRIFSALRNMRDGYEKRYSRSLPVLSMGMSGDYDIAIECGATLVRIGTAIFGRRNYAKDK